MKLQPLPGIDAIRALRRVLKGLLRQHGMRCVDLHEESYDAEFQSGKPVRAVNQSAD
jgi:hypothetical protein